MNILIKKSVYGLLAATLFFTFAFSFGQPVQAQSTSSQQAQMEELLALIAQLQARLAEMQQTTVQSTSEGGFSEKDIQIGSRVQTTDNLRVRSAAQLSASQIAVASPFTGGTVISGPLTSGGYTWWNVQYDNGVRGWSVQNWLISVTDYGRSVARNTPIDGTGFIDDSIDWQEDRDEDGDVNEKETALDALKEAQEEVEDILDEYYEDYEDKAEKLNREDDAQALINTFSFQLEFAEDAFDEANYASTIRYVESTQRHVDRFEELLEDIEDDYSDEDTKITLTSPKRNVTFDKSERNDDVVIKWTASDVPDNTNVIIEIEAEELYAGSAIGGGITQVKAKNGSSEHRIAIDSTGTMDAGEYKVRLSLEECHSLGCNVSYTFGPLKEDLEIYDRSNYGYFTVVNGDAASVYMRISGYGATDEIDADVTDTLEVNYYPSGEIVECKIIGDYNGGSDRVVEHPWPNTILAGQYGRQSFSTYGEYPAIELQELRVECSNEDGRTVATDSIEVDVEVGEEKDFEIIVGDESNLAVQKLFGEKTKVETYSKCREIYNNNRGIRVRCTWDGEEFFNEINWKG
jgi:hypothetical protein